NDPACKSGAILCKADMGITIGSARRSSAEGFVTDTLMPCRCGTACAGKPRIRPSHRTTTIFRLHPAAFVVLKARAPQNRVAPALLSVLVSSRTRPWHRQKSLHPAGRSACRGPQCLCHTILIISTSTFPRKCLAQKTGLQNCRDDVPHRLSKGNHCDKE